MNGQCGCVYCDCANERRPDKMTCTDCGKYHGKKELAVRRYQLAKRDEMHAKLLERVAVLKHADRMLHDASGDEREQLFQWTRQERDAIRQKLSEWGFPVPPEVKAGAALTYYRRAR